MRRFVPGRSRLIHRYFLINVLVAVLVLVAALVLFLTYRAQEMRSIARFVDSLEKDTRAEIGETRTISRFSGVQVKFHNIRIRKKQYPYLDFAALIHVTRETNGTINQAIVFHTDPGMEYLHRDTDSVPGWAALNRVMDRFIVRAVDAATPQSRVYPAVAVGEGKTRRIYLSAVSAFKADTQSFYIIVSGFSLEELFRNTVGKLTYPGLILVLIACAAFWISHQSRRLSEANLELDSAYSELKELQAMLVQSEKMGALGQLVAGVAHEIKNPLNYIQGGVANLRTRIEDFRQFLFASMSDGEQQSEVGRLIRARFQELESSLGNMGNGATRIKEIVDNLRDFSRHHEADAKQVDIHDGLDSTLELIPAQVRAGVTVERHYGELPPIYCQPGKLNQVFMNLLLNAFQAVAGQGMVSITTQQEKNEATIEIRDSGCGIAPENMDRIFDPFFTTKAVGKGTGLGLSISYNIVKEHGGTIEVESKPGQGALFRIRLPLDEKRPGGTN